MVEWIEIREIVRRIQGRHISESGKVLQKLLTLALTRAGYENPEEGLVEGVDIGLVYKETGKRHAFEVKTSVNQEVTFQDKDVNGLALKKEHGYEPFFAVLCFPVCLSEGWIIVPAEGVKAGKHMAMALIPRRDEMISELANDSFPDVLDEVGEELCRCPPGTALKFLKDNWGV